jgi:hypothetical protein
MQGWIKLHRKIAENPIWMSEPFTDGQALVDLILLANHKDGHIKVRGIRYPVSRGQVGWSEIKLAERWQWSRGKVRRFLKHLEDEKTIKIVQQKNKVTSIISIVNYKQYQSGGTTNGTTDEQQTVQQTDTNKNDNNEKNEENGSTIPPLNEFIEYALSKNSHLDKQSISLKYEAWKENGWKNGNDKKIKNWKTTLLNTIPYIKERPQQEQGKKYAIIKPL